MKTVEEYYRMLNMGELPVLRGHLLSKDDEQSRRYILEMMCRDRLVLNENDPSKNAVIIQRLRSLRTDGLVRVKDNVVRATPLG